MTPLRAIRQLAETWSGLVAAVSLFSAGIVAALALSGFFTLPARVDSLEVSRDSVSARLSDMGRDLRGVRRLIAEQNCLTLAERRHLPWQSCTTGD